MTPTKQFLYRSFVNAIWVYQRLFLDLHVWGRDRIPEGPKIYVTNHISSTDPYWVLPVFREPVHIIIGPMYAFRALAWIFDRFEQINAMPAFRSTVVAKAVNCLQKGGCIYTAPEGDLGEVLTLGRFYPGVARIYRQIQVPIIPLVLAAPRYAMREHRAVVRVEGRTYRTVTVLRGPYCINVGAPYQPAIPDGSEDEQNGTIMEGLRGRMDELLNDLRMNRFWLER